MTDPTRPARRILAVVTIMEDRDAIAPRRVSITTHRGTYSSQLPTTDAALGYAARILTDEEAGDA